MLYLVSSFVSAVTVMPRTFVMASAYVVSCHVGEDSVSGEGSVGTMGMGSLGACFPFGTGVADSGIRCGGFAHCKPEDEVEILARCHRWKRNMAHHMKNCSRRGRSAQEVVAAYQKEGRSRAVCVYICTFRGGARGRGHAGVSYTTYARSCRGWDRLGVEEGVHMRRYNNTQQGATGERVLSGKIAVPHGAMYVCRGQRSSSAPPGVVLDWKAGMATYI
jgi:hypothetical protein